MVARLGDVVLHLGKAALQSELVPAREYEHLQSLGPGSGSCSCSCSGLSLGLGLGSGVWVRLKVRVGVKI